MRAERQRMGANIPIDEVPGPEQHFASPLHIEGEIPSWHTASKTLPSGSVNLDKRRLVSMESLCRSSEGWSTFQIMLDVELKEIQVLPELQFVQLQLQVHSKQPRKLLLLLIGKEVPERAFRRRMLPVYEE